jgi:hypothetical protein
VGFANTFTRFSSLSASTNPVHDAEPVLNPKIPVMAWLAVWTLFSI